MRARARRTVEASLKACGGSFCLKTVSVRTSSRPSTRILSSPTWKVKDAALELGARRPGAPPSRPPGPGSRWPGCRCPRCPVRPPRALLHLDRLPGHERLHRAAVRRERHVASGLRVRMSPCRISTSPVYTIRFARLLVDHLAAAGLDRPPAPSSPPFSARGCRTEAVPPLRGEAPAARGRLLQDDRGRADLVLPRAQEGVLPVARGSRRRGRSRTRRQRRTVGSSPPSIPGRPPLARGASVCRTFSLAVTPPARVPSAIRRRAAPSPPPRRRCAGPR